MTDFLIFLLSLFIVILGAEWLLAASISSARLLRIPEMVIGATLVSLATTMPENLVSVFASSSSHSHLALGNIVGSGLVNLGLILGITLLVGHKQEEARGGRGRRRSLILFCLVLFIFLWLLIFGKIDFYGGVILVSLGLGFLIYTFWYALRESGETLEVVEEKLEAHPRLILKFITGAVFLVFGARFLVESGVNLAKTFALSEIVIGITLVAVGTSLPELMTALTALVSGHERVSWGNLTGATVLTLTFALGLAAIFAEVSVNHQILLLDFLPLLFFSGLVLAFAFLPRLPKRLIGIILILAYFSYLGFLFTK
ncbi:sodium:calcium antiporter [Candidatus Gottesmanbacteria bacterium]|nr:sodium:calcium antiporter [Candidatus Gottesmanbacteria bacterium]